jgi:Rrf2 family protein
MKLSTKSRYGLRILLQIAYESKDIKAVKGKDIAWKQNISEAYLEQIMIPLKNAGFVKTLRGCRGGYALDKRPEELSVLDVIELFEGRLKLVKCVGDDDACERCSVCLATEVWRKLSGVLRREAANINLGVLVSKMKNSDTVDYVI